MGKQAVFYAESSILEVVNTFVRDYEWQFVKRIRENEDSRLETKKFLDISDLLNGKSPVMFKLLPQNQPLPSSKDDIQAFWLDGHLHVELLLFLSPAVGYDSRIWFQTPNHKLEKEANALLRQVRKAIKAQEAAKAAEKMVST